MKGARLSRREFMGLAGAVSVGSLIAGCVPVTAPLALRIDEERRSVENSDEEPPEYTPYLNTRYELSVTGARPLPPGAAFWASPDILVTPTDALGNVETGATVSLQARVFNWGLAPAIATQVDFYWSNPALGVTMANVNLIGSKLVTVSPGNFQLVTGPVPWIPTFVNGGHEYLFVQCSCPTDPLTDPLSPALDRHVALRNMTVTPPRQEFQGLQLSASNPFKTSQLFRLQVATLRMRGEFAGLTNQDLIPLLASRRQNVQLPPGLQQQLQLEFADVSTQDWGVHIIDIVPAEQVADDERGQDIERYLSLRTKMAPDFNPELLGRVLTEFELQPHAGQVLKLEMPLSPQGDGSFMIYHVRQVVGGCEVGGYAVIVPPQSP
jgi:hypothetical protein